MKPPPQPRRSEQVAATGRKTLVGGFPWEPAADAGGDVGLPPLPGPDLRPGVAAYEPGPAAEPRPWHERVEDWIRDSPPLAVSLVVHLVVLLALALWIVRARRDDRVTIDLGFSSEVIEAPDPGVQIKPQPEPVPEPEPIEVKTEEPPVENPAAAPAQAETTVEAPGAAAAEASAAPIGTLLHGREEGRRQALVDAFGGSNETEAAVARALEWLARQQRPDGLWSLQGPYLDGGGQENQLAATAMALLAFQGAGNTATSGRHQPVVAKAWKRLAAKQLKDGSFDIPPLPTHHALYAHGQATIAACEHYGMTRDEAYRQPAQRAVDFAVAAQGENGGWRYEPGKPGDMSVTGWYLMALKSAEMAGLTVPEEAFARLTGFLDGVSVDGGTRYGYRIESPQHPPGPVTNAVSAEGLLCRQYLGWPPRDRRLIAGLELLLAANLVNWEDDKDVYAWYYVTQVAHHAGGEPWQRWNDRMKEVLPARQVTTGKEAGSWDPSLDRWGHIGGRLFTTCFCTYMLEVYYRHLPLYQTTGTP